LEASRPLQTLLEKEITAILYSCVEPVQHAHSALPIHTCISDGNTVLQARGALSGNILTSSIDMRLNHHTSDIPITGSELGTDIVNHFRLVVVVLLRVPI